MVTELEAALSGIITQGMKMVAKSEKLDAKLIRARVEKGEIVIMNRRGYGSLGIGKGLSTKVNANIGTSPMAVNPMEEIEKAKVAEKYGAHTISDLSMGGDIDAIRRSIFAATSLPITTVPIYQAVAEHHSFHKVSRRDLISMIKRHAEEGVSSIVVHAGFTLKMLEKLKKQKRVMGIVSKGGSLTAAWMIEHRAENPFLERFDEILKILRKRDAILSLGNSMRSGCIHDLKDEPQLLEIKMNSELAKRANEKGVQVIIEGMGGHVNAREIWGYVKYHKKMINNRPLFVAGPLPIDVAVGYDHIAACVGASIAAGAGADYLCYITPSEHLSLPTVDDVKEGVVSFRIAAYIGDSIKYGISNRDLELAKRRRKLDWEGQFHYALYPEKAMAINPQKDEACTMCGPYCAIKTMDKYLR
ncbi:MAG: phosphomethylpyrimidine synthase ThiC [archaeon]|nr:phosphomethylpyrimidine synthase ThiC [archaeon]